MPGKNPVMGDKVQYAPDHDTSPELDSKGTKLIHEIRGTLLYYTHTVDLTVLAAIGTIATQQASVTKHTMKAIVHILSYCATHPEAIV
jgi:hypothetical protein